MRHKILVIHQGALGDLVLSFPALLSLKHEHKASLALLCTGELGRIACELSIVDASFSLDSGRFWSLFGGEMTTAVKKWIEDYDTVILISFSQDMENHLRKNHGGEVRRITSRPQVEEETHVAKHMIRQLKAKGLLSSADGFAALPSRPMSTLSADDDDFLRKQPYVIIHPGAGSPRKRWPVEDFVRLAARIKRLRVRDVAFVLGPADSDLLPFLTMRSDQVFRVLEVYDVCHFMSLIKHAACFIGQDSGATHLAAFMGTPSVAIFGPSNPKRWSPIGHAVKVLRGDPDCVPCFEKDKANCEDPECLRGVSADMVFEAVREITL